MEPEEKAQFDHQVEADPTVADADGASLVHPERGRLGVKG